jgi:hypothetical protein
MSRHYKIGDKKLSSVTTIISDCTDKSNALLPWATKAVCQHIRENCEWAKYSPSLSLPMEEYEQHKTFLVSSTALDNAQKNYRDISKEALDVGSAVHHAIEDWLNLGKEPINPPDQVLAAFVAFLEWADEHKLKCDGAELTVTDGRSAGTLDFVGEIDHERTVVDFKASKAIYKEHKIQIAAYRYMYNLDFTQLPATRCGILRLDKLTGFPEYRDCTKTYKEHLNIYHKMVDLYYARHPILRKGAKIDITV